VVFLLDYTSGGGATGVIINRKSRYVTGMNKDIVSTVKQKSMNIPNARHVDGGPYYQHKTKFLHEKATHGATVLHLEPDVTDPLYDSDLVYLDGDMYERLNTQGKSDSSLESESLLQLENSHLLSTSQQTDINRPNIVVCHGFCSWSPGQLEDEINAGFWGWMQANRQDIFCSWESFDEMWNRLVRSHYLQYVHCN